MIPHGLTRKEKKRFFNSVYRMVEPGETILRTDQEAGSGGWKQVRSKWIGTVVQGKHRGIFRRRTKPWQELDRDEIKAESRRMLEESRTLD